MKTSIVDDIDLGVRAAEVQWVNRRRFLDDDMEIEVMRVKVGGIDITKLIHPDLMQDLIDHIADEQRELEDDRAAECD